MFCYELGAGFFRLCHVLRSAGILLGSLNSVAELLIYLAELLIYLAEQLIYFSGSAAHVSGRDAFVHGTTKSCSWQT
jgi:hypothetical protein